MNGEFERLRARAEGCRACDLWQAANQVVFGEGSVPAHLMVVGEQPGDQEDKVGHPFVGPAGRLLGTALERAGVDRDQIYLTNAVKHFKWKPRGKRRIHDRPNRVEVAACQPWLQAEVALVAPEALVLLGATAAQAIYGGSFRIGPNRGRDLGPTGSVPHTLVTAHPASVVRVTDRAERDRSLGLLVEDLRMAASLCGRS